MLPFSRPIKFVSNDGLPHAKRRRITAACKTCRKRKTRCSGEKPQCETCRQNNQECLGYSEPLSKIGGLRRSQPTESGDGSGAMDVKPNGLWAEERTSAARPPAPLEKAAFAGSQPTPKVELRRFSEPPRSPLMSAVELASPGGRGAAKLDRGVTKLNGRHKSGDKEPLRRISGIGDSESPQLSRTSPSLPFNWHHRGLPKTLTDQSSLSTQRLANRMPYFRYFGPTAIVPGYKQMVVEVRKTKPINTSRSASSNSPLASPATPFASLNSTIIPPSISDASTAAVEDELPLYNPQDPAPNHPLITHLVDRFFTYVGCNFPFLRRDPFLRDVEAKQADALLVDAVCAISARFSHHELLPTAVRSSAGSQYANRARSLVVDTFAFPTLPAVQACLLLAYAEFGSNRDSGLWMFLGCAIRMAQDLGLHKMEGMRGERRGMNEERRRARSRSATPKREGEMSAAQAGHERDVDGDAEDSMTEEERREVAEKERERTDTFWAVYFLDRVISSGTGRPVTLKDREIEIEMPPVDENASDGYPQPFPALIRIIHLYGRATDILNNIKDVNGTSADTMRRLSGMEADLTGLYQRLSSNLHFNVPNFQHYVKANQSSVFLLLHFWFHALIVLLHRPTLFIGFEGRIRQLFPNSHELSMSSAKTIADIVVFAELLDLKAVTGNPFNSQPIYIAACAFLQESASHASQDQEQKPQKGPPTAIGSSSSTSPRTIDGREDLAELATREHSKFTNHALLAQASQQNYQRCYKTMKTLQPYWRGVKYILTVMDQKAKGIVDPLLYTDEEMESVEVHRWGPKVWSRFTGSLKRKMTTDKEQDGQDEVVQNPSGLLDRQGTPGFTGDPSTAIGWSVTGFTNSSNQTLSFLYQAPESPVQYPTPATFTPSTPLTSSHQSMQPLQPSMLYPNANSQIPRQPGSTAEILLGLSSAENVSAPQQQQQQHPSMPTTQVAPLTSAGYQSDMDSNVYGDMFGAGNFLGTGTAIMLETEDVDFNALGVDMGSWLPTGYMPGDGMGFYPGNAPNYTREGR